MNAGAEIWHYRYNRSRDQPPDSLSLAKRNLPQDITKNARPKRRRYYQYINAELTYMESLFRTKTMNK